MTIRLTLEMPHGSWSAELPAGASDPSIDAVIHFLVRPVLRAATYSDTLVERVLAHDEMRSQDELAQWEEGA